MNLSKIEKAFVIILVVGIILVGGFILFIKPAYDTIGRAETRLKGLETERTNLYAELARESTIDDEVKEAKEAAKELEGGFYPDLTTYEAVEIAKAYVDQSGLETLSYSATRLSTYSLGLELFTPTEVVYDLKTYSKAARGVDENALLEGQFEDGGKIYTVSALGITDVSITDETGTKVEIKDYTDKMKEAHKQALCQCAVINGNRQVVGLTNVSFEVRGEYKKYLEFIDYLYDLDRATYMTNIVIPVSGAVVEESADPSVAPTVGGIALLEDDTIVNGSFNLVLFSVEQMEELETIDVTGETIVVNQ